MSRITKPFGQNKRYKRIEPFKKAFRPDDRDPENPGKRLKPESTRMPAAFKRIPPKAFILSFVAIAVIITAVLLFTHGNGSSNTQQAMAVYETGKESAAQTSSAPNAASASAAASIAPASASAVPSAAPTPASSAASASPASSPSGSDSSESDPLGSIVFKVGMSDPLVAFIQQRLMDLKYLDNAPTTELYGPLTQEAITSFQHNAGLPADGCVGSQTYTLLMSQNAPEYIAAKSDSHSSGNQSSQKSMVNVTGNITKKTNLSPAKLEEILPSALNGLGQALYNGEQQYNVNSLFIISIIEYESGNGTSNLAQHQNNLGGIKSPAGAYRSFSSKKECIDYMYNLLRSKYINQGLSTIPEIGKVYCTGDTWASNITGIMQDLIAQCS